MEYMNESEREGTCRHHYQAWCWMVPSFGTANSIMATCIKGLSVQILKPWLASRVMDVNLEAGGGGQNLKVNPMQNFLESFHIWLKVLPKFSAKFPLSFV